MLLENENRIARCCLLRQPELSSLIRFVVFAFFMLPVAAHSQYWAGILDPSRATDWTKAGIPGGIANYTAICRAVGPSGLMAWRANTAYGLNAKIADSNGNTEMVIAAGSSGSSNPVWNKRNGGRTADGSVAWIMSPGGTDTSNINAAISSCSGKSEVVQLQAGTYTITHGIVFNKDVNNYTRPISHVVLRGAGPDKTKLVFTSLGPCAGDICVMGSDGWKQAYTNFGGGGARWLGDNGTYGSYAKGDNSIDVGAWTGTAPHVGSIIFLDQRNDSVGICPSSGGIASCSGVSGATESGTTATITTTIPHGYRVGECVGIGGVGGIHSTTAYNTVSNTSGSCDGYSGWFRITAVPSNTSFQYTAPESGLPASGSGYVTADIGGLLVSNVHGATIAEDASQGRRCPPVTNAPNPACAPGEISLRSQMEIKRITSVKAGGEGNCPAGHTCYTIDPPLEMPNWRPSQAPAVWWAGSTDMWDGIEDLTYDLTNDGGGSGTGGIRFTNAYDCWIKNVRAINVARNAVWIVNSARIDVLDSYFFGTKGSAANSYAIESFGASDGLIQNNICQHVVACLMVGQDYGSVYGYNYMVDSHYYVPHYNMAMLSENHDFAAMNLFEGNDSPGVNLDDFHGNGGVETSFRNRIVGQDNPAKNNNLVPVHATAFNRALNFVGNILGTPGAQTAYQNTATRLPDHVVWSLGQPNLRPGNSRYDSVMIKSLLRWGNYDVATGAVRWCGNSSSPGWSTVCDGRSEIATTAIKFISSNPVPSSTSLPASFYLAKQPSFWVTSWGTPPWPAIGPDVARGTAPDGVGGYSYAIPAQLCFLNTSIDPAYQPSYPNVRFFNAAKCYPGAYGHDSSERHATKK